MPDNDATHCVLLLLHCPAAPAPWRLSGDGADSSTQCTLGAHGQTGSCSSCTLQPQQLISACTRAGWQCQPSTAAGRQQLVTGRLWREHNVRPVPWSCQHTPHPDSSFTSRWARVLSCTAASVPGLFFCSMPMLLHCTGDRCQQACIYTGIHELC